MSKIPRPSPRPLRELPITDDEKNAALPLSRKITKQRLKRDLVNKHEEDTKQEKTIVRPKEERKPVKKQLKKVTIPKAALPSTSKGPAILSGAAVHRQCKTLNRSKTEPSIKLDHVSTQRNEGITTSRGKQAASTQPDVHGTQIPKGVSKLKQRLSFRDKKPSKLEDNKNNPVPSKTKTKSGGFRAEGAGVVSVHLKTKRVQSSKVTTDKLHSNPNRNMNRSKTESSISLANVNKEKRDVKKATTSESKQRINKTGEEKKKTAAEAKSEILKMHDNMLSDLKDTVGQNPDVQAMLHSPQECPHSGLRFVGKPRKKSISLKFNFDLNNPPQTSNETGDLPVECVNEE